MTARKDNARDERGVAMMYVAVFLMSSLWLVSLAIDMGKLTVTKGELQRAADAAALAGASALDPTTGEIMQDSARVRAAFFASQNTALQTTSEPVEIDPQGDVVFPTVHKITVTVHREDATGNPMTTIFARTLGITSLNVRAKATAEVIPISEPCERLAPMAPVQQDSAFSTACGTFYQLKVGSGQGEGGEGESQQGNFQLLDYGSDCNEGPCAGLTGIGPLLECWTLNGYGCCVKIGDEYLDTVETQPGNHVGTIRRALRDLWELDTDQTEGICYQAYTGNGRRVVTSPIVETFDLNGRKGATIVGFAAFFLVTRPGGGGQGNVAWGQFLNYVVPGEADEEPPVGPKLYTLRLVENPAP